MALINTPKTATFDQWRINTNTTASELGDNAVLVANTTLSSTNAVNAILEVLAKEQLEVGDVSTLTTTATNLSAAVVELDADVGNRASLTTTYKTNLVGAINELDTDVGAPSSLTTTAKSNLVAAINELDAEHGVLSSLTTTAKNTFVASINEVVQRETDRYNNTLKLDLTDATVGGSNATTQTILSNVSMPSGKSLTIGGTLDISSGQLIVGGAGGALNIQTTYLVLGSTATDTAATNGGITVNRGSIGSTPRDSVGVYWDETVKKWTLKKFDESTPTPGIITPWIIDSYNAKDLIANNTESGIAVTWDVANSNFDFDVNDFTITLTGDVTGSGTVTNLGNVSFATTIQPNSVALGTDTTGAYVAAIGLAASNPGLTVTQSAAGAENNSLTNLTVDSTVIRDFGAQTINGVKTFGDKPIFNTGITANAASAFSGGITVAGNSTFSNDLTVNGNFTVTGTATYVNTETITLNDNIIVLNNNATATPTEDAGFEVERGNLTNTQLLWNEANDNWTMSNGTTTYDITGKVIAGSAITVSQGTGAAKAEWTVNHADTSSVSDLSSDNSDNTFIQDISFTFDTYGHVQTATVVTGTVVETNAYQTVAINGTDSGYTWGTVNVNTNQVADSVSDTLTIVKGGGINLYTNTVAGTDAIKIEHADTSSQASVNNNGYTYIQDITLDGYGHITAITSATWSATLADISGSTEDIQDIVGAMVTATGTPGINTEDGISVTYDDTNGKLNFNVNDSVITLDGAVSGSATMSNLGDVTISTSINTTSTDFQDAVKGLMPRIYNVSGTQVFP